MADSGRKDFSDSKLHLCILPRVQPYSSTTIEVSDKMTPDNSKSTVDKVSDSVTGAGDKIAR